MPKTKQIGGNILNSVSVLSVPAALLLARKMLNTKPNRQILTGGYSSSFGGTASKVLTDPMIENYLEMNRISRVFPNTLLPLGLLQNSLEMNSKIYQQGENYISQQDFKFRTETISTKNLEQYKKTADLPYLTSESLVPFALIVGQKTFDDYIKKYK